MDPDRNHSKDQGRCGRNPDDAQALCHHQAIVGTDHAIDPLEHRGDWRSQGDWGLDRGGPWWQDLGPGGHFGAR
jgi:hypothetical protein